MKKWLKPALARGPEILPPALQALLAAGSTTGRTGTLFRDIAAASTTANLILLQLLLQERQPRHTLEVGLAFGASTLVFAHHHARHAGEGPGHIAIDPFQATVWDHAGLELLASAKVGDRVRHLPEFSSQALPNLLSEGLPVDLAYIDGSHLFEDVFVDFYYVARLLSAGGLVLFDDSTLPDVRKVIAFIRRNLNGHFQPVSLRHLYRPGIIDGTKVHILRLLQASQLTCFQKIGPGERAWNAPFRNF